MNGWGALLAAAAAPAAALAAALAAPEEAQRALLLEIVGRNAGTEFGRHHGFAALRSVQDFRAAVPIRDYQAIRPWIERMAAGEPNVLVADPPVAFEETGGTVSGGKLIPYTAAGLQGFRAAVLPWLADLARRRPGITAGRAYVAISPVTRRPRRTLGGLPIGLESEAAYLGADLAEALQGLLAVPPEVAAIAAVDDWRLATLAHLVERDDLSFVSIWSPTFLLDLLDALPGLAEAVSSRLGGEARRRLAAAMRGPALDTTVLWPRLDTVSCWADGGSTVFARRLAAMLPHAWLEPKGLLATEAAVTLPWGGGGGAIPALTSTLVEFIDDAGQSWLGHDLHQGLAYRVVITTAGGLYRYDLGDRLRCVGHAGRVARLVFEGRAALVSDMVGEKLDEAFVAQVLAGLPVAAALVPVPHPRPHYELWLDGPAGDLRPRVEAGLRANPHYAYARDLGQLGPLAAVVEPGFVARRAADQARAGLRLGDRKHCTLSPS